MPSSLQKLGSLCAAHPRSCMHWRPGMSAVERHGRQNGKGDQAGRPSRLSQTGRSNDSACVQGRLSTACHPDLNTFPPNACPVLRRERTDGRVPPYLPQLVQLRITRAPLPQIQSEIATLAMQRFECTVGDCSDTCCRDFGIAFDKQSMKRMLTATTPACA